MVGYDNSTLAVCTNVDNISSSSGWTKTTSITNVGTTNTFTPISACAVYNITNIAYNAIVYSSSGSQVHMVYYEYSSSTWKTTGSASSINNFSNGQIAFGYTTTGTPIVVVVAYNTVTSTFRSLSSTNATSLTANPASTYTYFVPTSIIYDNGIFVVVGYYGNPISSPSKNQFTTSINGTTWTTPRDLPVAPTPAISSKYTTPKSITAWNNTAFVVVFQCTHTIAYSYDAYNWNTADISPHIGGSIGYTSGATAPGPQFISFAQYTTNPELLIAYSTINTDLSGSPSNLVLSSSISLYTTKLANTSISNLTAGNISIANNQTLIMNSGSKITANGATITDTEVSYLDGITSNVQQQLTDRLLQSNGGSITFTTSIGDLTISNTSNDPRHDIIIQTTKGNISLSPFGSIDCSSKNLTSVSSISTTTITSSNAEISFNNKNLTSIGTVSATSFTATSDKRIKANIVSLPYEFTVDDLKPVAFYNTLSNKNDVGFIAQEVEEIYPFMVNSDGEYKSLNYISIIGILVKEIQDLKKEIRQMKNL
jgi:hypothetical protein